MKINETYFKGIDTEDSLADIELNDSGILSGFDCFIGLDFNKKLYAYEKVGKITHAVFSSLNYVSEISSDCFLFNSFCNLEPEKRKWKKSELRLKFANEILTTDDAGYNSVAYGFAFKLGRIPSNKEVYNLILKLMKIKEMATDCNVIFTFTLRNTESFNLDLVESYESRMLWRKVYNAYYLKNKFVDGNSKDKTDNHIEFSTIAGSIFEPDSEELRDCYYPLMCHYREKLCGWIPVKKGQLVGEFEDIMQDSGGQVGYHSVDIYKEDNDYHIYHKKDVDLSEDTYHITFMIDRHGGIDMCVLLDNTFISNVYEDDYDDYPEDDVQEMMMAMYLILVNPNDVAHHVLNGNVYNGGVCERVANFLSSIGGITGRLVSEIKTHSKFLGEIFEHRLQNSL